VAERLGNGLQNRPDGFNSRPRLLFMSDIKAYLASYISKAESLLDQILDSEIKNHAVFTDPHNVEALKIFKSFVKGGKMIRGALTMLGYQIGNGQNQKEALKASVAIEMFHSMLLVQDDWIDGDTFRRHQPTVHTQYEKISQKRFKGQNQTRWVGGMTFVLSDIINFLAYQILSDLKLNPIHQTQAGSVLSRYLINTGYGEIMDITYDLQKKVSWDQILKVRELKTAHYTINMPLVTGLTLAAGKNPKLIKNAESYGLPVGIAFQLQDDILGIFGQEDKFGKSTSADLTEGKKSLLLARALEDAKSEDKKNLKLAFGNPQATPIQIQKARRAIKNSGALDYCQDLAQTLVQKGKKTIPKITTNPHYASVLESLADYIIHRAV
jgi:geranylgeranyl diphosphate synthase, type I